MTTDEFRPQKWNEYVGQEHMKATLRMRIDSAKKRHTRLDHVMLFAPAGMGKTTLAALIAKEMDRKFIPLVAPVNRDVLADIIRREYDVVVFVDEIHRGTRDEQEMWLTVLEEHFLEMPDGKRLFWQGFTFIGATTEPDRVLTTVADRFPLKPDFDDYTDENMAAIVKLTAKHEKVKLSDDLAMALGRAAGGTPRRVRGLVYTARDWIVTTGGMPTAEDVLGVERVTPDGLSENHMRYLRFLEDVGGHAGLRTIRSHLRLPEETVLDLERLLVRNGYLMYSPKGREVLRSVAA